MDCIEWWGTRNSYNYGVGKTRGRRWMAHRMVWEECYGPIPSGLFVLHHCDNPPCVNPLHLFLGTNADNMADMVAKGRQSRKGAPTRQYCKHGHEFTEENTRYQKRKSGGLMKVCRECTRRRSLEWYHNNKGRQTRLDLKPIK